MNQNILGEKKKTNFDDNLADYVNGIYDKMPEIPEVEPVESSVRLQKVSDGFIFHNLPGVGSVKLLNQYLDNGSSRGHGDWRVYCGHSNGLVVPNSIVLYQMARVLYELRNATNHMDVVKCHVLFTQDWIKEYPHTGTKIEYSPCLDRVVIEHLQLDGSVKTINLEFPEFTKRSDVWAYLVLAPEQTEENLGNSNTIPDNAKPILQELLGEGYEQAGEVFQYLSPRKNNDLREIILLTPSLKKRNNVSAVTFGVFKDSFSVYATMSVDSNEVARGVVAVKEK
ncbi:hypothetical protein HZA97_01180 [Candidatus Woesearchaeota archaeon]|nr:hypothetical protein [Candidatus Woesearchaeota archaeon]